VERADLRRLDVARRLDETQRTENGQFFTPPAIARLMASMFVRDRARIHVLDPGAGVGSLSAAFVERVCNARKKPDELILTAYEIDAGLISSLEETLESCRSLCLSHGVRFLGEVRREDFIEAGASMLSGRLFGRKPLESYDAAIVNPPYRKIRSDSRERSLLRSVGVETGNLYAGFLAIVSKLLRDDGQLVAITPRSFCNGPYFLPFRKLLLETMALQRIHILESRQRAFEDDRVLQENVIFHAVKSERKPKQVLITANESAEDGYFSENRVAYDEVVHPGDPGCFIRLVVDDLQRSVALRMDRLHHKLDQLDLSVSTGRVVDFRARKFLCAKPKRGTVPLIYPGHLEKGSVRWPKLAGKKPNALLVVSETRDLLVPSENYVLAKRFTTKEEHRRLVAAVYTPQDRATRAVAFENHLNYFHRNGGGLPPKLAKGLALYLSSTTLDCYFRQFNGHTQVNATDLRSLPYPSLDRLEALGSRAGRTFPDQDEIDRIVEEVLFAMPADPSNPLNPTKAKRKLDQALSVLTELGLPKKQVNERSALALLALLDLTPGEPWSAASSPMRGITQMMDFFAEHYGKKYAPNTRETIRKHSVQQFVQAGLVLKNPDQPSRATNSPKTVYQVAPIALSLVKAYTSKSWKGRLAAYLASAGTLRGQYARERRMKRLPVRISDRRSVTLSPGPHNALTKRILDDFCALFTPGADVLYLGDTESKFAHFDRERLASLGVQIEEHGKMPDVVVYHATRGWLILFEAVTSHGPIDAKRQLELEELFIGAQAGLVFVTAFPDRKTFLQYANDVTWETEVWIADSPTHLIHFDGERFLGPYEEGDEDGL